MTKYNGALSALSVLLLMLSLATSMFITASLLSATHADRLLWFLFWSQPVQFIAIAIVSAKAKED